MQHFLQGLVFLTVFSACHAREPLNEGGSLALERKELLKVAARLEKSLNELRTLEKAKAIKSGLAGMQLRQPPKGGAMDEIVAIEGWEGPVEGLLDAICKKYHYHLTITGKKPELPIIVSISTKDKTLGAVMQDADLQACPRAHIVVDHSMGHTIELRYVTQTA